MTSHKVNMRVCKTVHCYTECAINFVKEYNMHYVAIALFCRCVCDKVFTRIDVTEHPPTSARTATGAVRQRVGAGRAGATGALHLGAVESSRAGVTSALTRAVLIASFGADQAVF